MGTHEQRMASLDKANYVRTTNSQTWWSIRLLQREEGCECVADLLERFDEDAGDPLGAMPIRRLLLAVPRFGETKMRRYLAHAGVHSGDRKVGQLSDRQRRVIADQMRGITT